MRPSAPLRTLQQDRRPVEIGSASAATVELAARIRARLGEAWIGDLPDHSELRLQIFLADLLLDGGFPREALDTLATVDAGTDQWMHAGWRLEKGAQPALAARAFREACRRNPKAEWAWQSLARVDPAGALAVLDSEPEWFDDYPRGRAAALHARLLVASGHTPLAIATLKEALTTRVLGEIYWNCFLDVAPELARQELERLALTSADDALPLLHADALVEDGLTELAIDYLDALLIEQGARGRIVRRLDELDPRRAMASLRARVGRVPGDVECWSELGELVLAQGDLEGALDAWQRAFEIDPKESYWTEELWLHRPAQLLESFSATTVRSRDPELWGEYGDYLWRSGRKLDALDAWSAAARLDPGDDTFTDKLALARRGESPL